MGKLQGKTICITGASAGIGKAMAEACAAEGADLVLSARRLEALDGLKAQLENAYGVTVTIFRVDVRDRDAVRAWGQKLVAEKLIPDVLVNNAGLAKGLDKLHEGDMDHWEQMIDTNVKGLLYVTRALVPAMIAEKELPFVVNVGSTAGIQAYAKGGVYCATKAAVGFLSDGLRIDTVDTNLRVCNIRPGLVETDFSRVRFDGDEERAAQVYRGIEALEPEDVADALIYAITRPPRVQIGEITLMPNAQASGTVVHKS